MQVYLCLQQNGICTTICDCNSVFYGHHTHRLSCRCLDGQEEEAEGTGTRAVNWLFTEAENIATAAFTAAKSNGILLEIEREKNYYLFKTLLSLAKSSLYIKGILFLLLFWPKLDCKFIYLKPTTPVFGSRKV